MRRLPIYFLIDVSESMVGEPIEQVQEGIGSIIKELRADPYALETVYVSIIVFAGKAQKITPLIELYNFYPPKLPIGAGTSLGSGINFLIGELNSSLQKTTLEQKGDWKPIIFLFTDGNPTDKFDSSIERWNKEFRSKSNLIVISLGDNTNISILGKMTDNVLLLKNTDVESFKKFFKWVTASIKTSSISIANSNNDSVNLAPVTNGFLSKIDLTKGNNKQIDENFAVILAKCQFSKRHYLIKYQKRLSPSEFKELALNTIDYKLVGAFPIEKTYFDLSDGEQGNITIGTSELLGFPTCPCCGNQFGLSQCVCGGIMCTGEEEVNVCPWCGIEARFGISEGGISINRTRG
jgi:uncharacterized protein YegL